MVALVLLAIARPACSMAGEEAQSDGGVQARAAGTSKPEPGAEVATTGDADAGEAGAGSGVPQEVFGHKIVKTADLCITSDEVRGYAANDQQIVASFGGTIVRSQTYGAENSVYADPVISIPSGQLQKVLDELRAIGEEITTDAISGQDVTEE